MHRINVACQVLDALFAVRTRASMQPITIARRAAFFATTGLTTLSSTTSRLRYAKEPLSTAPILYLDVLGRDGSDALIGWRKLLTAPFLGLKQAASNEHEGSRASRNSHGKKGGAGNEGISWSSMSLWVVPGTVQQYSHSFLRGAGTHGCGLRFVGHAHNLVNSPWAETSPSSSSSSSPPERLKIARDLSSARVMVKATHSDNGHFDDESLYREIKVRAGIQSAFIHTKECCCVFIPFLNYFSASLQICSRVYLLNFLPSFPFYFKCHLVLRILLLCIS